MTMYAGAGLDLHRLPFPLPTPGPADTESANNRLAFLRGEGRDSRGRKRFRAHPQAWG